MMAEKILYGCKYMKLLDLFYDSEYDISWKMFHSHLKRMYILL